MPKTTINTYQAYENVYELTQTISKYE